MYSIYDVAGIGLLFLILYVLVDFIRNKTKNVIRRLVFYSFNYYLLNVVQVTTGGIIFPPQDNPVPVLIQLIPFYFVADWLSIYRNHGLDWFFWNSVKLSFYNFIMLMPFGIYMSLLFRPKREIEVNTHRFPHEPYHRNFPANTLIFRLCKKSRV